MFRRHGDKLSSVFLLCDVTLTAIGVHSQHSGAIHEARAVRVEVPDGDSWATLTTATLTSVDEKVAFRATTGAKWKLLFATGKTNKVVIRGLRFYYENEEIFPPFVPYRFWTQPQKPVSAE